MSETEEGVKCPYCANTIYFEEEKRLSFHPCPDFNHMEWCDHFFQNGVITDDNFHDLNDFELIFMNSDKGVEITGSRGRVRDKTGTFRCICGKMSVEELASELMEQETN